ncbi:MAG: lytic transglycosylase [Flavobacterium sp. MedPE-SWcel]|mgnify:CR=1 FL=1|uniref:lytic transglycosylase domain-containing protein n=1 Tax=uncultured Flavobacterium sp. TaxID=165435 RepID=UPI00091A15E0|nr:lytic transglycosylase domain-containing protein [uncultured Flavobacterium sp.]OIQ15595.1 MAG: lytic transglycosylase [Flavobacterium sp. MedPE-SWcel]
MKMNKMLLFVATLFSCATFAQESAEPNIIINPEVKLSYIDSVKATFVRNEEFARLDSLWVKELTNKELFATMQEDMVSINTDESVDYNNLSTEVLKERLAKLDATSPFNIEYNEALENTIKSYLKYRKKTLARLMTVSEYYFPMFEEHLAKYDIPLEIKYLAIVESALNPRAKSRVGASGLWQFMYATGKQYNLKIDSYVDERYDPLKATEAACQYLSRMYKMFGEWDLVLASYNAGPGNVMKAMRRSGSHKNYWNIRPKLPRETRNYVPAFLATMYLYEYADEHGIKATEAAPITYFETDTIMVKRALSFKQISNLLDMPVDQIQLLNPIYKLDVIPYILDKPHYVRLPKDKIGLFVSNEDAIYAYVDHEASKREKPLYNGNGAVTLLKNGKQRITTTKRYRIRNGDNLGAIANKFHVSVRDIKRWNGIRGTNIRAGKYLKILKTKIVDAPKKEIVLPKVKGVKKEDLKVVPVRIIEPEIEAVAIIEVVPPVQKSVKGIDYEKDSLYVVQKGDSLFSIAKKHRGVTVENLKHWNKIQGKSIKPGMKLKVAKQDIN